MTVEDKELITLQKSARFHAGMTKNEVMLVLKAYTNEMLKAVLYSLKDDIILTRELKRTLGNGFQPLVRDGDDYIFSYSVSVSKDIYVKKEVK
jgi:hypothetical protein